MSIVLGGLYTYMLYIHVFTHLVACKHRNGCVYQPDGGLQRNWVCLEILDCQKNSFVCSINRLSVYELYMLN